jgi:MFS family permease
MSGRWLMLAVVFVARLSLGFQFQAIGSVTPDIVRDLGLSYAEVGGLIGLFSLPGVVLAFPGGLLGRRFGERPVAIAGLALMAAGAFLTGSSGGFALAAAGRTLSGAGFVIANTVFAKMVADWFAGKEIATAMAVMLTAWPAGIGIALVSLGAVASAFSWRVAVHAGALAALLGLLLVVLVYRRPPAGAAAPAAAEVAIQAREVRLSVVGGIMWGALNGSLLVFLGFTPGLLIDNGATAAQAGAIVSITLWITLVSIPLGGQLVDRMGQGDYAIVFGAVATALCIGALPGFGAPAFWCVLIALAIAMPPGAIMALLPRAVRPEILATAFGIFYSVYYAVVALVQPLAGLVRDRAADASAPIVFAGAVMGLTAVAHLVFIAMRAVPRRGASPPFRPSSQPPRESR